MNSEMTNSIEL